MCTTKRQLSRNHGWLFRLTWPLTHYLIVNISAAFGFLFFKLLNKTTIIGKRNVPYRANTLLLANHQSMIDSFLIGVFAFFPASLIRPGIIPWNPAAEENFYRNPFQTWIADNWKCIPVKKGRKDVGLIFKMGQALRTGTMILFPEGTRSRDGSIGKPRGGAGMLIRETRPSVIPVYIDGMDQLLPIGAIFPRIFKRIYVYYGEPLRLDDFYDKGKGKEVSQEIMNRVMDRIRAMRNEIQTLKAGNGRVFPEESLVTPKKIKRPKTV